MNDEQKRHLHQHEKGKMENGKSLWMFGSHCFGVRVTLRGKCWRFNGVGGLLSSIQRGLSLEGDTGRSFLESCLHPKSM
jgi:hypothetical protein